MFTKHYHYDFIEFCEQLESIPELSKYLTQFKNDVREFAGRNGKLIYLNFYEILDNEVEPLDWGDDFKEVLKFVRPYVNDEDLVLNVWW